MCPHGMCVPCAPQVYPDTWDLSVVGQGWGGGVAGEIGLRFRLEGHLTKTHAAAKDRFLLVDIKTVGFPSLTLLALSHIYPTQSTHHAPSSLLTLPPFCPFPPG